VARAEINFVAGAQRLGNGRDDCGRDQSAWRSEGRVLTDRQPGAGALRMGESLFGRLSAKVRRGSKRVLGSFSHTPATLTLVWRTSSITLISLVALMLVSAACAPAIAWVGKLIVDAVLAAQSPDADTRAVALNAVWRWIAVEFALAATLGIVERLTLLVRQMIDAKLNLGANALIFEKALSLELGQFENS
jgi:hypothetical protein